MLNIAEIIRLMNVQCANFLGNLKHPTMHEHVIRNTSLKKTCSDSPETNNLKIVIGRNVKSQKNETRPLLKFMKFKHFQVCLFVTGNINHT